MEKFNNIEGICNDHAKERLALFQKQPAPEYKVGDYVKAALKTCANDSDYIEHIWFIIDKMNDDTQTFTGLLNNHPVTMTAKYKVGDKIEVPYHKISQYLPKDYEIK
jgi:uncharacterized protein YegJ (DUF2314 family)